MLKLSIDIWGMYILAFKYLIFFFLLYNSILLIFYSEQLLPNSKNKK